MTSTAPALSIKVEAVLACSLFLYKIVPERVGEEVQLLAFFRGHCLEGQKAIE